MRKTERILSRADNKGQAAMEFLMTYGWAILAAVIVVGVLWYLLGNPANLAGTQFQVGAPLVAKGVNIVSGVVTINILNGASDYITVTAVNLTDYAGCVWTGPQQIDVGKESIPPFGVTCASIVSGSRINSDIAFSYTEGTSLFARQTTGSVSGKVQ